MDKSTGEISKVQMTNQYMKRCSSLAIREMQIKTSLRFPNPSQNGYHQESTGYTRDTCIPMFVAALFTTAKQPRCPTTNERIKKI
jgi:hypothetical protein